MLEIDGDELKQIKVENSAVTSCKLELTLPWPFLHPDTREHFQSEGNIAHRSGSTFPPSSVLANVGPERTRASGPYNRSKSLVLSSSETAESLTRFFH